MTKLAGRAILGVLLGLIVLAQAGCDSAGTSLAAESSAGDARLRVLHGVADAPPVDWVVDDNTLLSNLPYRGGSAYRDIASGSRDIRLDESGTGSTLIEATPTLAAGQAYSLLALGSRANGTAAPLLLEESQAPPPVGSARLRVVHGVPELGAVDIYITAPQTGLANLSPTIPALAYRGASASLNVTAGTYQIRITAAGQKGAIYDSGPVALQEGAVLTLVALPVPDSQSIGVVALSDEATKPLFQLANVQDTRLRIVHASPTSPAVDVRVDGTVLVSDLPYGRASDYLGVATGNRGVRLDQTGSTTDLFDRTFALSEPGTAYTLVALGDLSTLDTLLLPPDQSRSPSAQDVQLRLVHAVPNGPALDVYITPVGADLGLAAPVATNLNFQDIAGYLTRQPGSDQIRITPSGTQDVIYDSGSITFEAGDVMTLVAITASGGSSPIRLVALSDNPVDASFPVPDIHARVRVVHASPDTPPVDVRADGTLLFNALGFGNATPYESFIADDNPTFSLSQAGVANPLLFTNPALARGTDYTLMAVNFLSTLEPLVLTDNNAPPLEGNAKVRVVQASPDAPPVEVRVDDEQVTGTLGFRDTSPYLQLAAGTHNIKINGAGTSNTLVEINPVLQAGSIYTVIAINPLANIRALVLVDTGTSVQPGAP